MGNNKAIQFLRGTRSGILKNVEAGELLEGQPLYNITDNYLTIGTTDGDKFNRLPIRVRELGGYAEDSNGLQAFTIKEFKISADTSNTLNIEASNYKIGEGLENSHTFDNGLKIESAEQSLIIGKYNKPNWYSGVSGTQNLEEEGGDTNWSNKIVKGEIRPILQIGIGNPDETKEDGTIIDHRQNSLTMYSDGTTYFRKPTYFRNYTEVNEFRAKYNSYFEKPVNFDSTARISGQAEFNSDVYISQNSNLVNYGKTKIFGDLKIKNTSNTDLQLYISGNDDAIFFGNTDAGNSGDGVLYTSAIKRDSYSFPDGRSVESLLISANGAKMDPQQPDTLIQNNIRYLHLRSFGTLLSVGTITYLINSDPKEGLILNYVGNTKLSDNKLVIGTDGDLSTQTSDGTSDRYLRESNVNKAIYQHAVEITINGDNGLTFGGYLFSIGNIPSYSNFKYLKDNSSSTNWFFFGNLNGINLSGMLYAIAGSPGNNYFSYYDGTERKLKYFSEDSVDTFNDRVDRISIY